MRKLLIPLALFFSIASPSHGEDVKNEAIESLGTAQQFIKDGNYHKATEEINYALAKMNELTAIALLDYIPEAPEGYELVFKNSQGVNAGTPITGNAGATANYSTSEGSTLDLKIAIGGMTGKMASLTELGAMLQGLASDLTGGHIRQVRVQGYTGTETFDEKTMSGTLAFQVGAKTSVTIQGKNIQSAEILMNLAKKIDFNGLEKSF
ncbi:MAG: hypothetical protein ACWGOX_10155 [Desulforhopalus sp.]